MDEALSVATAGGRRSGMWLAPTTGAVMMIFLPLAGCGAPASADPAFVQWDSAGIRMAESARPAWGSGVGWRVDPDPVVTLGQATAVDGDSAAVLLDYVGDVVVAGDGRIVVNNQVAADVLVFDSTGHLLARFGGKGGGPGEMEWVGDMWLCGSDTLLVRSTGATLHRFGLDGAFLGRARYAANGVLRWVVGPSPDCGRILFAETGRRPAPGEQGTVTEILYWTDSALETHDTVAEIRAAESLAVATPETGTPRLMFVPWGAEGWRGLVGDRVAVAHGDAAELRVIGPGGAPHRIARWSQERVPVTADDRRRYDRGRREFQARVGASEAARRAFPELDRFSVPSWKPFFDDLVVADDGGTWLRHVPAASLGRWDELSRDPDEAPSAPRRWVVLDSAGTWLGDVELPPGLELHAVAHGRVYGVVRDSLGVQSVRVHRILR